MDNKTAVEWYSDKLLNILGESVNNFTKEQTLANHYALKEAKEMEKEQIAKAFDDGDYNYHYSRKTGDDFENGKEYFNELYK
jgi:hypothetical protein